MKIRLFNLGSMAVRGTAMLCAVAISAGSVLSCDRFDDTEINSRLDSLEERVKKLEESLTSQINALNDLIQGMKTVSSVAFNEETGIYTILLSDNTSIEIPKADASVPKIGVAKDEKGAYYWTIDGEPVLAASGDKIYMAPSVRVNSSTGEWEVSADGGATYVSTGIKAGNNASLITKIDEDDTYVYFTLSDGSELKVAKTVDFSFSVLAGKQYFREGETRVVKLALSGVKKNAVYSKPDGWKASVSVDELSVTAPAAGNTAAEKKGVVIVQAWFNDGTSDILELKVEVGKAPHQITIQNNGTVFITHSESLELDPSWQGSAYQAMKFSEFSEEAVLNSVKENTRLPFEKDPKKTDLKTLLGKDIEKGETYVVWLVDKFDNGYGKASYSEVYFSVISLPDLKIEVKEKFFDDAVISVTPKGISKYYGGVVKTLDADWDYIIEGINYYNEGVLIDGPYNGNLSKYAPGMGQSVNDIRPGQEYTVFALPYEQGKQNYTYDDMITAKFIAPKITLGGNAEVVVGNVETTMTTVKAKVSRGAGTYKFYADYFTDEEAKELPTDEALLNHFLQKKIVSEESKEITKKGLAAGAKGWIIALAVDKNGVAGKSVKVAADAQDLTFSDIKLPEITAVAGLTSVEISIPAVSGIKKYKYISTTMSGWLNSFLWKGDFELTEKLLGQAEAASSYYKFTDAQSDGSLKLSLENLRANEDYVFLVEGIDDKGAATRMAKVEYTPEIKTADFVKASDPAYKKIDFKELLIKGKSISEYSKEEYEKLTDGVSTPVNITLNVPENCSKIWVASQVKSDIGGTGAKQKTAFLITDYYTVACTPDNPTALLEYFNIRQNIYIMWQDKDGKYYEFVEIVPVDYATATNK